MKARSPFVKKLWWRLSLLWTDEQTDRQGDSYITPPPPRWRFSNALYMEQSYSQHLKKEKINKYVLPPVIKKLKVIFLFPQICNVYKNKCLVTMFTNKDFYEWFQLFIVQSFPNWFVHFWMTFCKYSMRISCQIIFVNKHWPQSWASPFNGEKWFFFYLDMQDVIFSTYWWTINLH